MGRRTWAFRSAEPDSTASRRRLSARVPIADGLFVRLSRLFVMMVVTAGVFAAGSVAGYQVAGRQLAEMQGWPQPLGWFTQILAVESLPTSDGMEIRWIIWAVVTLVLLVAAVAGRVQGETGQGSSVLGVLAGVSVLLVVLTSLRSVFAAVPQVGWMWTWQLGLALLWMLVMFVWTMRLGADRLGPALALAAAGVAAASLLFCAQAQEAYPHWPTGNVLLVTTVCLAGVFLLGGWFCRQFANGRRQWRWQDVVMILAVAGLLAVTLIVLGLAGRRAAVVGLLGGVGYLIVAGCHGRVVGGHGILQTPEQPWPWGQQPPQDHATRLRLRPHGMVLVAIALGVIVPAAVLAPRVLSAGRWQSVQYRLAMYKAAGGILADTPAWLVGIGPGHLGFDLTARMRPLHAESPRVFHGILADHVHSEPLEAIAELGVPAGLIYLALPLGGLVGFWIAQRQAVGQPVRWTVLGAGAALAATLTAEATSIGMRQPGCVAMLVWALIGMGWACGAQAGGFVWLTNRLRLFAELHASGRTRALTGALAVVVGVLIAMCAWMSLLASARLYQAKAAWSSERYAGTSRLLASDAYVPTAAAWMDWKYLEGRAHTMLMQMVSNQEDNQAHRTKATEALDRLVRVCPAYVDAPVWLARVQGEPARSETLRRFLRYDPYNTEARLLQASQPDVLPVDQLESLRLVLRNACVTPRIARMISQVAANPAGQERVARWVAQARQAVEQPDPGEWSDPLVLEGVRIAIVAAGQQGNAAEALERANQAAILLKHLSRDPWRNRPESVEMEIHLDQAWFGWLARPDSMPGRLDELLCHLQNVPEVADTSFSQGMAAQFAAMLLFGQGKAIQAEQVLFHSDPTIDPRVLRQMRGMACARLLSLMGAQVSAETVAAWTAAGRQAMGEDLWPRALEIAQSRGQAPWWLGVLRSE